MGWFYRAPILLLSVFAIFNFIAGPEPHFVAPPGKPASVDPRISDRISMFLVVAHLIMVAIVLLIERKWPNLRRELPPSLTPASRSGSRSAP